MFEFYRGEGYISIFFFIIVYIGLFYVMLNLFLVILLDKFDPEADGSKEKEEDTDENAFKHLKSKLRRRCWKPLMKKWRGKIKPSAKDSKVSSSVQESEMSRMDLMNKSKTATLNKIKVSGLYD